MSIEGLITKMEQCGFSCEAGPLENSRAWQELKKEARDLITITWPPATDTMEQVIRNHARWLIEMARQNGLVLTIETRPLLPLAMGDYELVVDIRERRVPAVPYAELGRVIK